MRTPGKTLAATAAVLGGVFATVAFAPASWLARGLAAATSEHLLIVDTSGSVWNGSGLLVLTGGAGSRDAATLPGRLRWTVGVSGTGFTLTARQDCCLNGELKLKVRPGFGRFALNIENAGTDWLARLPAAVLTGLGTPWNTLQPEGALVLSAHELGLESAQGRWRQSGTLQLDLLNLSSRLSTLAPLGSYRLSVVADAASPGVSGLRLSTLEGALQLSGTGTLASGASRFTGEASAAPGREDALNNLLNIIGRRQGARSVLTIG